MNMYIKKSLPCTLYVICAILMTVCSSTPDRFDRYGIPHAIDEFSKKHKQLRLAVLDFVNTDDSKTKYDTYIADRIVSELSAHGFTLLERKQLKLLLKEQTLSLNGVISPHEALKIGKLLPVDVIVTGSYTMLGSKIEINGKFIHVVSGEIIHAFSTSLVTSGHKDRSDPWDKRNNNNNSNDKGCKVDTIPVDAALKLLKTKSEINRAVHKAVKIPFDEQCGKIHYRVMLTFTRYKIHPEAYKYFLIKTITSIKHPQLYKRSLAIMRYFAADHKVDQEEWKAMVIAFRRVKKYSIHVYMYSMLNSKYESDEDLRKRTGQLMDLAIAGKIGQPVPTEDWRVFFSILNILRKHNRNDLSTAHNFFKKYKDVVPSNKEYIKKTISILTSMYWDEGSSSLQNDMLKSIVAFSNKYHDSSEIIEGIWFFGKNLDSKIEDKNTTEKIRSSYMKDIRFLNNSLGPILCSAIEQSEKKRYGYRVTEAKIYLIKYNISCGNTANIRTLMADLQSRDIDEKYKAAEILAKAGMGAKDAEQLAIRHLDYVGHGYKGNKIRQYCAVILGNIKTKDPKAIMALIDLLKDINLSYQAKIALKNIGALAISYIMQGLDNQNQKIRYACAELLGEMGRDAKSAIPALQRLSMYDRDYSVKNRAKMSIKMIQNDY